MFDVFSDLVAVGGENLRDDSNSGDHQIRNSSPIADPLKLFDGTEFVRTMSQDFDPGFYMDMGNEELMSNLNNFLITSNIDDSILATENFGDVCSSDPFLCSETSVNGAPPASKQESIPAAGQFENLVDAEEAASSPTSSVQEEPQFQQFQQTEHAYTPSVAFTNNGLLNPAPKLSISSNSVGKTSRLVKSAYQPQQHLRAPAYTPPPTPSNSKFNSRAAINSNSRGAQYAREYREKNRKHVEELEGENGRLQQQNDELRVAYGQVSSERDRLNREVAYLRKVLQNQSALASILNAVSCNAPGLKLQFSQSNFGGSASSSKLEPDVRRSVETRASSKRKLDEQQPSQQTKRAKGNDGEDESNSAAAGICLHVNGDTVSVEFCARCSREARCVDDYSKQQQ